MQLVDIFCLKSVPKFYSKVEKAQEKANQHYLKTLNNFLSSEIKNI